MNLDLSLLPFWGDGGGFLWFSRKLLLDLLWSSFKSKRWMPWHLEPKKDVGICDKPRGVDNRDCDPRISEWGNPAGRRVTR